MKNFIPVLILATLALASCATTATPGQAINNARANIAADIAPNPTTEPTPSVPTVDTSSIDPLQRLFDQVDPNFVQHAQAAIAIDPTDVIFVQCMNTLIDVRADLRANPLFAVPTLNEGAVDPNCPLCLLAAKRKLTNDLLSGDINKRIADTRTRIRGIETKVTLGCAPLLADERLTIGRLAGLVGTLGH